MCVLKTCLNCKKEFKAERNAREYCGRKCTNLSRRLKGPCTVCGVKHSRKRPTGLEAWYRHPKTGKIICDSCYGKIPRKRLCVECGNTHSTRWSRNEKGVICHKCEMVIHRRKVKLEVLTHYSKGKPICSDEDCDVDDVDMLVLDHIKDDGAAHRKGMTANGTGIFMYDWAKRNHFPKMFGVLCWNHNIKKQLNKVKQKF